MLGRDFRFWETGIPRYPLRMKFVNQVLLSNPRLKCVVIGFLWMGAIYGVYIYYRSMLDYCDRPPDWLAYIIPAFLNMVPATLAILFVRMPGNRALNSFLLFFAFLYVFFLVLGQHVLHPWDVSTCEFEQGGFYWQWGYIFNIGIPFVAVVALIPTTVWIFILWVVSKLRKYRNSESSS